MGDTQLSTNVWVRNNNYDTAALRSYALEALSQMSTDIDTFLPGGRVDIIFTPNVGGPGGWGFTDPSLRECRVNSTLGKAKGKYTVLHELSHVIDPDMLNHAAKVTIAGLMTPTVNTAAAGFWGNSVNGIRATQSCPSETYANTFPQAFAGTGDVAGGYYTTTIASGNWATYRTTVLGSAAPTTLTLAAAASAGATNLKYSGATTGLTVGDWLAVGTSAGSDVTQITSIGTSGSGGTGIGVSPALFFAHTSGTTMAETSAPSTGGTQGSNDPTYQILIDGNDWTTNIPAETIHISESGSDAGASCDLTFESADGLFDSLLNGFPKEIIVSNLLTGTRLFGGHLTGGAKRHLGGPQNVAYDLRFVSHDVWLDRRFNNSWWTTVDGTKAGTRIADDQLIVQAIINNTSSGGHAVGLIARTNEVKSTNSSMPKLQLSDGSLRDNIRAVGDAAATTADPTARRVYVDFYKRVHYFKGNESNAAPYIIGDASYADTVKATTGLVAFWPMSEASGTQVYDTQGSKTITLAGNYLRGADGGVVNEPDKRAVYFANSGYGLVSSAALHPGNTFSIECWFQRRTTGSEQTLFDAGTADYAIEFQADDTLRVYKKGTGNDFTTNATYTDTNWHHLVVTHSGSATHVYVDGNDKAGTAALKSFVPSTNNLYIGRLSDGTLKLNGLLQDVAFYSTALSSSTVIAHYNDGQTIVPDYIDYDRDWNNAAFSVYVRGGVVAGTGWSTNKGPSNYGANAIIDRPESVDASTKLAVETAWLKRDGNDVIGGHITVEGYDGWRAGQTLTIDDATLGINGSWEIKYMDLTLPQSGSDVLTYDIYYGAMPWRGTFDIRRKGRRNSVDAAQEA